MRATIITIGDEIIGGETVDTNSAYIARRLGELGIGVARTASIGDTVEEISSELRRAIADAGVDLVFVTGGLGPTDDDVTKRGVAVAAGRRLVIDHDLRGRLEERFRDYAGVKRQVIESLATVPQGSRIMENPVGAASGLSLDCADRTIYVLPGVPHEMEAIFEGTIAADLRRHARTGFRKTRLLRTVGIRESQIAERLNSVIPTLDVRLGFLPRLTGVDLRLTASANDETGADKLLEDATQRIVPLLGRHVFSTEGVELNIVVGNMLIERRKTIAIAESCTGGLLGHLLTEVAGISACLERGIIAYSNEAKVENLGVDEALISDHGAVSPEVAQAMAVGIRRQALTDIGISTTGIAGPTGGSQAKPVGLVYAALAHDRGCTLSERIFKGTRDIVKQRAAFHVLDMLRCYLLDIGG